MEKRLLMSKMSEVSALKPYKKRRKKVRVSPKTKKQRQQYYKKNKSRIKKSTDRWKRKNRNRIKKY